MAVSTSGRLDLDGKLLKVQIVLHVLVDGLADESCCLGAILLGPFSIKLFLGLAGTFL
jgi:hypothetical protein